MATKTATKKKTPHKKAAAKKVPKTTKKAVKKTFKKLWPFGKKKPPGPLVIDDGIDWIETDLFTVVKISPGDYKITFNTDDFVKLVPLWPAGKEIKITGPLNLPDDMVYRADPRMEGGVNKFYAEYWINITIDYPLIFKYKKGGAIDFKVKV